MESGILRHTIRKIKRQDNPTLAAIIRSVCEELKALDPGTIYFDPKIDDLFSYYNIDHAACFVSEVDGTVVGCAGIYPTDGLPHGHCEFVKFYLLSAYRRRGIGRELLSKCLNYAAVQGYSHVYLESVPQYSNAISLYEKSGFSFLKGPLGNSGHFGCTIWMLKSL